MKLVSYHPVADPTHTRLGVLVPASASHGEPPGRLAIADLAIAFDNGLQSQSSPGTAWVEFKVKDDLAGSKVPPPQMLDLLKSEPETWQQVQRWSAHVADQRLALTEMHTVGLASPVPIPASIRDCMEFRQHVVGSMQAIVRRLCRPIGWIDQLSSRVLRTPLIRPPRVWSERPLYYKGNCRSVIGTGSDVAWPRQTQQLDFELEFGVFIRGCCKDVSVETARHHIGGYSLFNDFSARDIQLREMQGRLGPAKGKDFDTGNAIGPYLVTPDEIDERSLDFEVRVNGETWSKSSSATMKLSFAELISFISRDETLYPGDFIASGTMPNGCGLELDRWLQVGDVIELDGGPLGVLRNQIVSAS